MSGEVRANVHAIAVEAVEQMLAAATKVELRPGENRLDDGSKLQVKEVKNRFKRPTLDLATCQLTPGTSVTLFKRFEDGYTECQLGNWQQQGVETVELGRRDRLVVGFRQDGRAVVLELI